MIEVKNLVKDYGGRMAVDHLTFTVEDGYIYGFLGPNGAGKSTTMNMMTGYLGATSGEVLINGHNILEEPEEAKRHIGYLPEIPPLYTDMTVMEYLKFAAELKKIPKKERVAEVERVVEVTRLEDVKGRLIRNLSKGYKQRVGLAQAILGMPSVIILDEPTVGLDPKQIIEIRDLIKELGKQHTVILSSHILSEVRAVCDRVMILAHGKLVASDTPENLETQLTGHHGMELLAKGSREQIFDIVDALECRAYLDHILIEDTDVEEEKKVSFELVGTEGYGKDVRECVFYGFANAHCPILCMAEQKKTLEEVFLELTESEAQDKKENADEQAEDTGNVDSVGKIENAEKMESTEMIGNSQIEKNTADSIEDGQITAKKGDEKHESDF